MSTGSGPWAPAAGDFDGNGHVDIAVANEWIDNVMALRGDGEGGLIAQTTTPCSPAALVGAKLGAPGDGVIVAVFDRDLSTYALAVILEPLGVVAIEVIRTEAFASSAPLADLATLAALADPAGLAGLAPLAAPTSPTSPAPGSR